MEERTNRPASEAKSIGVLAAGVVDRLKDRVAEDFHDLGNYGVSELLVSVNPSGNPMTCSAVSGTGYRWPSTRLHQSCQLFRSGFLTPRRGDCLPPLNAVALGVGHNEHSVPKLSGTSVGSRYAVPFSIIPERGQVSENSANSPSKQSCDVFHEDEFGSYFANKAGELSPQSASCAFKTCATACKTNILAGKSSNDCIRENAVSSEHFCGKASNIVIDGDSRETGAQGLLRLLISFAKRYGFTQAGTRQAKVNPANTCEQAQYLQLPVGRESGHRRSVALVGNEGHHSTAHRAAPVSRPSKAAAT